jgi:tetratricopeptide (TPR) repeat protein
MRETLMIKSKLFAFLFAFALAGGAAAQSFVIDLPLKSQAAEVSQRIGLTDVTVRYHRPLVQGRKIWGALVPYGKVWRTGANFITAVTFSDPVTIEGKPLDRGTYGLHAIPTPEQWTLIFSKNSTSWGSFTYDPSEDALRVTVTPRPAPMHEALAYEFDDLQPDSALLTLKWDTLAVPMRVAVDVHAIAQARIKEQLRGQRRWMWNTWNDAAGYLLSEKISLDDALAYANRSIKEEDRFDNELTKSKVLRGMGRDADAVVAERRALELGTADQLHDLGVSLLDAGQKERAFAVLAENAQRHPRAWVAHEGLARMYAAQGKRGEAAKELELAMAAAPAEEKAGLAELAKKL